MLDNWNFALRLLNCTSLLHQKRSDDGTDDVISDRHVDATNNIMMPTDTVGVICLLTYGSFALLLIAWESIKRRRSFRWILQNLLWLFSVTLKTGHRFAKLPFCVCDLFVMDQQ